VQRLGETGAMARQSLAKELQDRQCECQERHTWLWLAILVLFTGQTVLFLFFCLTATTSMTTAVSPVNCSTCPRLYEQDPHWLVSNTTFMNQLVPSKLVRTKRRADQPQRDHERKDRKQHGKVTSFISNISAYY